MQKNIIKHVRKPWLSRQYVSKQLKETIGEACISDEYINKRIHPFPSQRAQWYYFLYTYTRMSLAEIGKYLGNKNHATVLHGINKYINTELILNKEGEFVYAGLAQEQHLFLSDIFDEQAKINQNSSYSRGNNNPTEVELDLIYVRQREIISRLLQKNLVLMEKIKQLEEQEMFAEA